MQHPRDICKLEHPTTYSVTLTGILFIDLLLMNIIRVLKELAVQGHSLSSLKSCGS